MSRYFLKNALILTGDSLAEGSLGIDGERIAGIWHDEGSFHGAEEIDLNGRILMAGGIDAHVHFRDPGLTWKADIGSESYAAILGGITTFIDMPNTFPPTTTPDALEAKLEKASKDSKANYGFHFGATNSNAQRIKELIKSGLGGDFAGIKVFMGSSTGNMLVDEADTLEELFQIKGKTILVHCEDEGIIKANLKKAKELYGDNIPFAAHPEIRSREACVKSTRKALDLAIKYGTHLHILHVSTKEEVQMIREARALNSNITAETSVNYLWFCDEDYEKMEGKLKCNPAIKTAADRQALIEALKDGTIDTIGSDHAPHLLEEKAKPYLECPSGLPTVQQSLPVALTLALQQGIPLTRIASAFSEKPAKIFRIVDRGRLREGYYADLVVVDPTKEFIVRNPAYKCGWTPYEGCSLKGSVDMVWINGSLVGAGKTSAKKCGLAPDPHSAQ